MDRRKTIKSLLAGSVGGGLLVNGCTPEVSDSSQTEVENTSTGSYGRLPHEKERDKKLNSQQYFNEHELATIAELCDIILPPTDEAGGANDAGVPEFVEFIVKDLPENQLPIRGGIMWLDNRSNKQFKNDFVEVNSDQQIILIEEIAYPDRSTPDVEQGVRFFNLMRNLTLTGYYTTKMGIEDLGYKGNIPNVWEGVPEEILKEHGMSYEKEWLAKCIDQTKRSDIAEWDEEGNLLN